MQAGLTLKSLTTEVTILTTPCPAFHKTFLKLKGLKSKGFFNRLGNTIKML